MNRMETEAGSDKCINISEDHLTAFMKNAASLGEHRPLCHDVAVY